MRQVSGQKVASFRWMVTCACLCLSGTSVAAAPEPTATTDEARPPRGAQGATLAGGTAARSRPAASTARGGSRGPCETSECFLELGKQAFEDGNYKAAADHLRHGLSIFPPDGKPEVKKASEEVYAKARKQIATVELTVTPADAEVKIDGRAIPLDERAEVFVEAGEITVEAGAKGFEPFLQKWNAMKNWTTHVRVTLKAAERAEPSASESAATASVRVAEGPNKALMIGSAVAAGAVMVVGGVLVGVAEGTRSQLQADAPRKADGSPACASSEPTTGANAACNDIRSRAALGNALGQSGIALLLAGAGLGTGTAVYGLWPRGDKSSAGAVMPVVGPGTAGFVWSGSF